MKSTGEFSASIFEPCHIEAAVSPFFAKERRSLSHPDRLSLPLTEKENEKTDGAKGEKGC